MKISVITVCFNSANTIRDTLESIRSQSYDNLEYILVDGGSTDGTMDIVAEYSHVVSKSVSEPDNGLWDAMNKGLKLSSGEYIGFLNSDDFFAGPHVIERISKCIEETSADAVFGYLNIVDRYDTNKIIRRYRVSKSDSFRYRIGLMPAHPTFYCKKKFFLRFGGFINSPLIAPDFELMVRFTVKGGLRAVLLPEVLVKMRNEGIGNSKINYRLSRYRRQVRSCRMNGLWTNQFIVMLKLPYKLYEYII